FLPPPGYLDLTDEQKTAAEALREQARTELEPLHEQIRTLHEQLRTAVESTNPDATAIGQLVISIHNQRVQIRTLLEGYGQRFAALLTPEQLTKWENFKELRRPRRGGPDGPWGPPGDEEIDI
ncbi:MAG: Spy/CpxP family protein refolding chaperone, partial [Thermoanaerobaculia bacterium]|nr:Spy/CpxP family protein refolding chaperone [Thermoanaerobaculia bacterium]